jgi:acyl-CoA reductase-like NAD-dependent aldehyde dehydrogenase
VLGSMIDEKNAERVEFWVAEARAAGAEVLVTSKREGNRLGPCVLKLRPGLGAGFKVVDEEVFGPVLVIQTYERWNEAVALANQTRFGLQCGLFTDSLDRVRAAVDTLSVGGIIVGDVPTFRVDNMPYGGVRDSGLGREGVRLVAFAPPRDAAR